MKPATEPDHRTHAHPSAESAAPRTTEPSVADARDPLATRHVTLGWLALESGDRTLRASLAPAVNRLLADFPWQEAEALRLYYGIDGEGCRSQVEIAEALGLTPSRVHEILSRAMDRLYRRVTPARRSPRRN